ncbi:MAG: ribonuclease J [Eubacterium sp.]|jgi:ribonuclease J|nr:ribonuclease J [Eubacterium sp.]
MAKQNTPNDKSAGGKRNSKKRYYTYRKVNKKPSLQPPKAKESVRVAFLGGMNEIGKNMTVYEYKEDMFILDCGIAFPGDELPGVDLVIPDFTYIEKNISKIRGLIITHGHEDHIGGIAYLLKKVNIPIYATKLTIGLIKGKLKEHGLLESAKLVEIKPHDNITLGSFNIELIHVNHSIPDAVGLAIRCPAGILIHTGDFKIDTTPVDGDMIDLTRFAEYGKKGVLALFQDSTNAERPGYTMSEKTVGESFVNLFRKAGKRRIVVATFASNIHRVQQIIDVAQQSKRKVAVIGRSLENLVQVGEELGYLNVPKNILINIDNIKNYEDEHLVIITTGSQGEPMSALTKMAFGEHRKVVVSPNDYVIISATPIPGNEKMVGNVVNELMKRGIEVIYEKMYEVHVSGHACQEELKLMMGIIKPKFFIPVHGEQKHLQKHALLAQSMGFSKESIYIGTIGNHIEISEDGIKDIDTVPSGEVYVDGIGVGDVGNIVLNDRKHLSQDGLIVVVATINTYTGEIESGPDIVSRGFVYVRENEDLMNSARELACRIIEETYDSKYHDWNTVKGKLRDEISHLMYEKTKRSPMILPVLMEI